MRSLAAIATLAFCFGLQAQTPCACDPSKPETMQQRQCSLCEEAEKQAADTPFFFLKDKNPAKPNRLLILPRIHTPGQHLLRELTPEQRTALWSTAIEKAKSLWGDDWAVAYNSDRVRTQCHTHLHIGKLLPGVETDNFIVVDSPAAIPLPTSTDDGIWIHGVDGKIHVHTGEPITETVLLR
jgi:diadenosine tetraphosphate (Ap4A) HIT family hydrolase